MNERNMYGEAGQRRKNHSDKSRLWIGGLLLIIGGLLLARTSGVLNLPDWVFSWPMIFVIIGLFTGLRHGFNNPAPLFFLLVGGIFLADRIYDDINLRPYLWPILLIAGGAWVILRPKKKRMHVDTWEAEPMTYTSAPTDTGQDTGSSSAASNDRPEILDLTAVFGGVKKNVISKNFKGGEIVAVMGGAEVNLSQADFKGRISIDNLTMFGGTKLIIPSDWDVQSEVVAIFGGVDDKRAPSAHYDPNKVLYLEGTCLFGGIEIRNF